MSASQQHPMHLSANLHLAARCCDRRREITNPAGQRTVSAAGFARGRIETMKRLVVLVSLLCMAVMPSSALGQETALGVGTSDTLGSFLTDAEGMTLYIFTNDTAGSGKSVCNDDCAANWPPYFVEGATLPEGVPGELSTITRDDGTPQLAYNGMPLYLWVSDTEPGQTTGEGVGDVWFVASIAEPGATASPVASPVMDGALGLGETPELGQFLTDAEGMTLYIFTNDVADSGASSCYDDCAANWPPFFVEGATLPEGVSGELTLVTRDDDWSQLAYNGMPLYYWVGDAAPGDVTGQGVGDVWFVASVDEP
jgi:predicted lipoprotein with Yx(FWY)xxD motif